jgi:sugar/nucleoside kinase (ribokinase family)
LLAALHRVLGADLVCITRGENGAVLCPESDVCGDALRVAAFRPAPAAAAGAVGDTTGCGDIFLAGLVHGELCAWPRERSGRFAAAAAGWNAASLDLRVPTGAEVEELLSQGGH